MSNSVAFSAETISFDKVTSRTATQPFSMTYPPSQFGTVVNVGVALMGVNLEYDDGDHNVLNATSVISSVTLEDNTVGFLVEAGINDDSGHHPWSATVTALVILSTTT